MRWVIMLLSLMIGINSLFIMQQEEKLDTLKLVKKVDVNYPKEAKEKGIEGTVILNITVDTTGCVSVVSVKESDDEIFNNAAINAILQYKYAPLKKEIKALIPFKFELSK